MNFPKIPHFIVLFTYMIPMETFKSKCLLGFNGFKGHLEHVPGTWYNHLNKIRKVYLDY